MNKARIATTYTRILARTLGLKGNAVQPLLQGTDVTPTDIEFEKRELTRAEQYQIIENALKLTDQPGLGLLVGEQVEMSTHGILGLAAMTSATLNEALSIITKYHPVRAPFLSIQQEQSDRDLIIRFGTVDDISEPVSRFLIEAFASMLQTIVERIVEDEVTNASLLLTLTPSQAWETYRQHFHCAVTRTDAALCEYAIPLALANMPCPTRNEALHERAEVGCRTLADQIAGQATWRGKVEALFRVGHAAFLSLEDCAQLLHVSSRTLNRRLLAEGTSYHAMVDSSMKSLAVHLLGETTLTVDAIAYDLGYEHPSNFRRAFRRWFGMSPATYRKQHLNTQRQLP
ncbi:AraC family transcriptional regulator [Sinimarinibacterium sp. CAU 1509]|uniref:AraC family transcriptional regulator n=1 Tax=Sinimarinibacterium sp. CAU 1509 TaxID=2562283 RepID=UPI00146F1FCB|nr:AraC family transcriptional regulator [Sinimarinibacterium sp. CAU 1509]